MVWRLLLVIWPHIQASSVEAVLNVPLTSALPPASIWECRRSRTPASAGGRSACVDLWDGLLWAAADLASSLGLLTPQQSGFPPRRMVRLHPGTICCGSGGSGHCLFRGRSDGVGPPLPSAPSYTLPACTKKYVGGEEAFA